MSSLKDRKRAKKRKLLVADAKTVKTAAKKLHNEATKVAPDDTEFKAGKEARATENNNCLACMHWKACPSKKKSRNYACTKLKGYPVKKDSSAARLGVKAPNLILNKKIDKDEGLSKEERVISQLISRTLKGSGVIAAESRLDDRDIPTAPNFYTWITSQKFMGDPTMTPWAKQIEHPTKLLAEWCPNPRCTDHTWWNNVPVDATPGEFLDHVTFLEYGVCPKCFKKKSQRIKSGKLNPYNALAGLAGQRSAKTATAVMIIGYDHHRLLKSQNPSAMYGVMSSQVLTGTFAALTFEQAKDNIWSSMYNMLNDSPWFKQYHEFLKQECYRMGMEDVHQVTNTYARYRHRNLFYHVSGPNKRTMRGKTRVMAMIDEIGWFLQQLKGGKAGSDPERLDAKGTHIALDRSLMTVRVAAEKLLRSGGNENVPMGYLYETSSPSAKNDMIMQRYEASRGSRTIYGYRMATWEANPQISRDSETILEAYRDDPIAAHRDYAAVPPVSGSPFVKLPSLRNLFSNKRENGGLLKTVLITNRANETQTSGSIKKLRAHTGEPCVLAVDAGYVNNSFAFTVLYASGRTGRIICPFVSEIFPTPEAPVHFPDLVNGVLAQLIEHYNVRLLLTDRWQNIMLLQTVAEEHGIGVAGRSLKYPDFDAFRQSAIYDGNLMLPMLENKPKEAIKMASNPGYPGTFSKQPLSHLLYQLVAVNDVPNVSVIKPDGGTDDMFRALVLAYTGITDPVYAEFFEEEERTSQGHIGIVVGGMGANGGAQMSSNVGVAVGPRNSLGGGGGSIGVVGRNN